MKDVPRRPRADDSPVCLCDGWCRERTARRQSETEVDLLAVAKNGRINVRPAQTRSVRIARWLPIVTYVENPALSKTEIAARNYRQKLGARRPIPW
jgi:hypothetical protein